MLHKLKYLARSFSNFNQEKKCPYCGSKKFIKIDSKYLVTTLLGCQDCYLGHRHPKDEQKSVENYYQSDYTTDNRMMTNLPDDSELEDLKKTNFPNLRDYSPFVEVLLGRRSGKVIDYGCSWGYSVFQLVNAGFDASGFELSVPRAEYGRRALSVKIVTDENDIGEGNDLIQSSHVIEHLFDIKKFVSTKSKLKEDGIFMVFCPNGSKEYQMREPDIFHVNWGFAHPNYLNVSFASQMFANNPYLILTGDWEFDFAELRNWDGKSQVIGEKKDGKELLIIAKPNKRLA